MSGWIEAFNASGSPKGKIFELITTYSGKILIMTLKTRIQEQTREIFSKTWARVLPLMNLTFAKYIKSQRRLWLLTQFLSGRASRSMRIFFSMDTTQTMSDLTPASMVATTMGDCGSWKLVKVSKSSERQKWTLVVVGGAAYKWKRFQLLSTFQKTLPWLPAVSRKKFNHLQQEPGHSNVPSSHLQLTLKLLGPLRIPFLWKRRKFKEGCIRNKFFHNLRRKLPYSNHWFSLIEWKCWRRKLISKFSPFP